MNDPEIVKLLKGRRNIIGDGHVTAIKNPFYKGMPKHPQVHFYASDFTDPKNKEEYLTNYYKDTELSNKATISAYRTNPLDNTGEEDTITSLKSKLLDPLNKLKNIGFMPGLEGGLVFEYEREGEVYRLILGFTELGAWIEFEENHNK